jgi:hypothetical protein
MTMDDDKVTAGEIFRRLIDMDKRYQEQLDRIETQVRTTNGRTTVIETTLTSYVLPELKRLIATVFPASPRAVPEPGESISVKISPKLWVALAAGAGMVLPGLVKWIGALLQ